MLQGSRHIARGEMLGLLERAGATERNGRTSSDDTCFFETVPSEQLALALWIESERMGYFLDIVDDDVLRAQRDVVLNERRQMYEATPYAGVWRALHQALYPAGHPYARLTIGDPSELESVSVADVAAFYRARYAPNAATLVVSGDVDMDHTRALVSKYFAGIPYRELARRASSAPARIDRYVRIDLEAGARAPRIVLAWTAPPAFAAHDHELRAVARVLTSGTSSRLARALGASRTVEASIDEGDLGSAFLVTVTGRVDDSPEELVATVEAELSALARSGPTDVEASSARAGLESELAFVREACGTRAERLASYARAGVVPSFDADASGIRALDTGALREAIRVWLPIDRHATIVFHPVADAPVSGRLRSLR
jgi:zinc protease